MAKSFFERLTGSIRVSEDGATAEKGEDVKKPVKAKEKIKSAKAAEKEEALKEKFFEEGVPKPSRTESRAERRFFAVRGEEPEVKEPVYEEPPHEESEGELTLDVFDEGANFIVQAMVAGVRPEDIDISFDSDTLTLRGSRRRQHEIHDDHYYVKELYWGKFSRSVVLPEEVDSEKAEASLKGGLLILKIPKKLYSGARKIKIKTD